MSGFDEDTEPLVQVERSGDDSDEDDDQFDPYANIKRSNTKKRNFSKVALIIIISTIAAAIAVAALGLLLGIVGLNKTTASSNNGLNTVATTASPVVGPTNKPFELVSNPNCGEGLWYRMIFLNMSDPSHECPRAWRGYDGPVRCCGRPVLVRSSCPAVFYPSKGFSYSKVCGRALGYQQGSPDGFATDDSGEHQDTIDGIYAEGVSLTHGNPRSHIWTFAAGLLENGISEVNNNHRCPCDNGQDPPAFIGQNYFCETGDHDPVHNQTRFYDKDPLWDGKGCVESTCCAFHSPPWFSVKLPRSTTDDIEVRICGDQGTGDEDTPIALLEIYVQE